MLMSDLFDKSADHLRGAALGSGLWIRDGLKWAAPCVPVLLN